MKKLPWKALTSLGIVSALMLAGCTPKESTNESAPAEEEAEKSAVSVPVKDYHFDTAGNMFAYTEFELSGEPLVEGLGLNLDVLDPKEVNQPSEFDYTAGVESYEYSEEAMYEVIEKSGLGLHMVNAPMLNQLAEKNQKDPGEMLGERFYQMADAVGYPKEEIFRNMYPTFIEFAGGDPHYIEKVNTEEYASNEDGSYVPVYQVDFKSLRWDREKMDKTLVPAAYGSTFLKQAMWAGDFMGGFHTVDGDEELGGETPKDDDDKNIALGVSSADGMQGMILTEGIWNKLKYVHGNLFYNPSTKKLEQGKSGVAYNPKEQLLYLPHEISVKEKGDSGIPTVDSLEVTDASSMLRDQWLMLWPSAEFYGMTDQRTANENVAPSFRALFDGNPYPSAPKENIDDNPANDVASDDPYTLNRDVLYMLFKNIEAMHYNEAEGAFVEQHNGEEQGKTVNMFDAGYTMEALRLFQRSVDGLPVGYASGEAAKGLETEEGKKAIEMITKQASFIMDKMLLDNGLVANSYTIGEGADKSEPTLDAQLGAIRGLTAAYLATKDDKYRDAARSIYQAMDKQMWDEEAKAYKTNGDNMTYTPYTAGALSAVFRIGIQNLSNQGSDSEAPENLERDVIIERYTDFYRTVIDGPSLEEGMQVSEFWDTGDFYKKDDNSGNTDGDTVPQIQAGHGEFGISPVLVEVEVKK
ncbi:hypothetical protein LC040_11585 [Bacillus tianshenii]|nr:hypothetical protein LC040_11585 [Bacillus tianshenii]